MENHSNHHPITMTRYFFSILFFIGFNCTCIAQDTLKEQNSVMYSKYYVLHENNRFEYFFHHCTGVTYGQGNITKGLFRWKFEFDSLRAPSSIYSCSNGLLTDSVKFNFRTTIDSNLCSPYNLIIDRKRYFNLNSELTLSKNGMTTDSLQLIIDGDSLIIYNDLNVCNEITLYLNDGWRSFVNGGKDILKKKGNTFHLKSIVWIKDDDEYWKKGKRRKYLYQYRMN